MPEEYQGREPSYLKHRVLREYLMAWAQKRASSSRFGQVRLVYVDCFAGPWENKDQELKDTSVYIGLAALESALATWGNKVKAKAVFVEKNPSSFKRLRDFLGSRRGYVETVPILGAFGDQVDRINSAIGQDPAFLFIDPTGWKGMAMQSIAPLARPKGRDDLINVMFNHINRFKDDDREFLRAQLRDFFGLGDDDLPVGLSEEKLLGLYRGQLKLHAGLEYAANLAVSHGTRERTWFHLVVGGHHPAVIQLFRDTESRICGREADAVRTQARSRSQPQQMLSLGLDDTQFERLHLDGLRQAREAVLGHAAGTRLRFLDLWTVILQEHHITRTELAKIVRELAKEGRLSVEPLGTRGIGDDAVVRWDT